MTVSRDPRNGNGAYVDQEHRLTVSAVSISEAIHVTEAGDAYNLNSGLITLSNSTETPILYFENHEDSEFIITAIALGIGNTGTHTGTPIMRVRKNPTSIDFSAAADINQNRNLSSSKTLKATTLVYKGAAGDTVTGGSDVLLIHANAGARLFASIDLVVGVGNSIVITLDAQVTAATADVYAAIIGYIHHDIT